MAPPHPRDFTADGLKEVFFCKNRYLLTQKICQNQADFEEENKLNGIFFKKEEGKSTFVLKAFRFKPEGFQEFQRHQMSCSLL